MQIKQQLLAQHIQKKIAPIYILIGQEHYLLEENLNIIKSGIKKTYEYEEKVVSVQSVDDWGAIKEEANSYSLFAETVLINIFYDKKSIDAAGKKTLTAYIKSVNSRCFIVIRAPNIPAKQLQWLYNSEHVVLVAAYPLNNDQMKQWIVNQLKRNALNFEQNIPDLIQQYTQGNMLACAQVIEKIALSNDAGRLINSPEALAHLSDQCVNSPFELVEACLSGRADKAIHILKQAANSKTEVTLVLWMLTQEVRLLLQLLYLVQQKVDFNSACSQLKIWPQRINLYQVCIKRFSNPVLQQLHYYCKSIDEQIKSNLNTQVWNALEKLSLSLCLGQYMGDQCLA